jgi:elongator complex protein 3
VGFAKAVLDAIRTGQAKSAMDVQRLKMELARVHQVDKIPSNAELLAEAPEAERARFLPLLRMKPMRTASGVAVVAVQTSPEWCPHGTCTFCPGGPVTNSAKSYTGFEPAARRAGRNHFDPYLQTAERVAQLQATGHSTDKIDLILMGGTLTARMLDYQEWFVKRCYDAMNDEGKPSVGRWGVPGATTLDEAMERNERAQNRCIGITVETKPDWCLELQLDVILGFGTTRVELGVQTTHEDVLAATHRGHTLKETVRSTQLVKDSGLKLCYHMMPGLPGSTPEKDIESFARIFSDSDFRPDMIKIYPTLVIEGTRLYEDWRRGRYKPYTTQEAAEVVAQCKRLVPPWVRIQRVDRDIPIPQISAGVDKSNLRQIALARLKEMTGKGCPCIRCREVGLNALQDGGHPEEWEIVRQEYDASGGREVFISVETPDRSRLLGFVRLRRLGAPHRPELSPGDAIVRELKVYGPSLGLGEVPEEEWQHRGWGRRLMEEAERVAQEDWGLERLFVLPGVGVRQYYERLGFGRSGPYMVKALLSRT